jgi:hypothetical protein
VLSGIGLVSFLNASGEFAFIIPPFQKRNPDWEAVGFVATAANEFFFEWKQWGESETRFGYTRYRLDTGEESGVTRDAYIDAYRISAAAAPGSGLHTALFARCRQDLSPDVAEAVHFTLRSREDAVKRTFRTGEGVASITTVPVWEEKGLALALMPGGRILSTADGAAFNWQMLPSLPKGFRYTDLLKAGGALVLPWEQVLFTDVRAAGFLLYKP